MIKNGVKYKLVKDNLGSILAVIDSVNGNIVQQLTYSIYGQVLSDTNPGFQPFGFAGGLYDSDTKLVRFGAREYNGTIGRWMTKDPILFNGGDTNLYGYVLQDPVNWVDPSGLELVTNGRWDGILPDFAEPFRDPRLDIDDWVRDFNKNQQRIPTPRPLKPMGPDKNFDVPNDSNENNNRLIKTPKDC